MQMDGIGRLIPRVISLVSFSSAVDLFYMKTCCFRGAQPRTAHTSLFCDHDPLEARYSLSPCHSPSCLCCHPLHVDRRSPSWAVINFESSATHRFLIGYTTYLNAPAVSVDEEGSMKISVAMEVDMHHDEGRLCNDVSVWPLGSCRLHGANTRRCLDLPPRSEKSGHL